MIAAFPMAAVSRQRIARASLEKAPRSLNAFLLFLLLVITVRGGLTAPAT